MTDHITRLRGMADCYAAQSARARDDFAVDLSRDAQACLAGAAALEQLATVREVLAADLAVAQARVLALELDAKHKGATVASRAWQLIETAPRGTLLDGRPMSILVWWPSRFEWPVDVYWDIYHERWANDGMEGDDDGQPTHWMPLPAPPETGDDDAR